MKQSDYSNKRVGEIVAKDFRAASLFKKAGINFSCSGSETLEQACISKRVNLSKLEKKLAGLEKTKSKPEYDFANWTPDVLCNYIEDIHHKKVRDLLPQIVFYTHKTAIVHGANHPELPEIHKLISAIDSELWKHLEKEEEVLFPAIRDISTTNSSDSKNIIVSEISRMKTEHEFIGKLSDVIRNLSRNYALPTDACTTYELTYKLLGKFEDDLHIHLHLENNILYPKALKLLK